MGSKPKKNLIFSEQKTYHLASIFSGGDIFRIWGFLALSRWGMQVFDIKYVPREFIECIRSNLS
jgi:hypothetical protein